MIRRPPRSTLFPTRRSSDLAHGLQVRIRRRESVGARERGEVLQRVAHAQTPRLVDRKSTRLNSSHANISYAVFCLKKKKQNISSTITISNDLLISTSITISC